MKNKFDFYEIVKLVDPEEKNSEIHESEGVILGMSQNDDGSWSYAVDIGDDGWSIEKKYLVSTGQFSSREAFYDEDDRIKVIVDEHGRGNIVEKEK